MGQVRSMHAGVLFVLFACTLALPSGFALAQGTAALPVLNAAVLGSAATSSVFVHGDRFTPGGDVYIDMAYASDEQVTISRWVKASETVYDTNGGFDPMTGYVQGGVVSELFDAPCGANIRASAYDEDTDSWSNPFYVVSGCGDQAAQEP